MKSKAVIVSISIVVLLLAVSLAGCATPPAAGTTPTVAYATTVYVDQQDAKIQSSISSKAEQSSVNSLQSRLDNLAGGGGGSSYSKAEIDSKIASLQSTITTDQARIKVLEDKLAGTGSGGGGGGSVISGDYGTLIDTDGSLELWLERQDPASDPFRLSAGSDEAFFSFVIVNKDSATHKFKIEARLLPEDAIAIVGVPTYDSHPDLGDFSVSRGTAWATASKDTIYFSGINEVWINKNATKNYAENYDFTLTLNSVTATYWTPKFTIDQIN